MVECGTKYEGKHKKFQQETISHFFAESHGRRKLPSIRLQGTLSNTTSGQRPNLQMNEDYRVQVFLLVIDQIDAELERRFSKEN